MAEAPTGIELRAKLFPLAFLLYLFPPTVEVDGQPYPAKWGTQFLPMAAGSHTVAVFFKYIFLARCNLATTQVQLSPGQVLVVTYKTRWLVFLPGKISVEAAPAAA